MFQTLFKFNADCIPMFSESLVTMTDMEVFKVCQDSGSRAIEAFLASPAKKQNLKKEFIAKLKGKWAQLGLSPIGSHVLEACYREADARQGAHSQRTPRDKTGLSTRPSRSDSHAPPRCHSIQSGAGRVEESKQKTAETMMSEFEKEFGGEEPAKRLRPKANRSRRRRSERRPTPQGEEGEEAKKRKEGEEGEEGQEGEEIEFRLQ